MSGRLGIYALAIGALCATGAFGCSKASEKVGTTETTSAEVEPALAAAPAAPKDDYLAAVRREQLVLRRRLEEELRAVDHELAQLRKAPTKNSAEIQDLLSRRQTLEADANVVDRADERGWDELKATIERDLEDTPQM